MTIKKGREWGHHLQRPSDLQVVADDFAASERITQMLDDSFTTINLAIVHSVMARALGLNGANLESSSLLMTQFDLIQAIFTPVDSRAATNSDIESHRYFVGNAFIGKRRLHGVRVGVMNSSFDKKRDWAPRAHPNDGRLDVIEFQERIKFRQRMVAMQRMKSGTHLPHPNIRYHQATEYSADCSEVPYLFIEGRNVGRISSCRFVVMPDAVSLYW